jgi:hypothetical protein
MHGAMGLLAFFARLFQQQLQFVQQAGQLAGKAQTGGGQLHLARGAVQQAHAQFGFQLADAAADCGLGEADFVPGRLKLRRRATARNTCN